jgi:hypothetical protein
MVNDAQAPTIRCPANVETPTDPGRCTAYVTFEPTAGDNCTGVTLECVPPSGTDFPIGTSTVTCIAAGGSGGTAQCTFVVAVTAGTEPALPYRFWKNHPNSWPSRAMPMTLGTQSYNQEELLAHLSAPTTGDASLILARQMIVATLNTANGSDPRPVCDDLRQAHRLLSGFSGRLPYNVHPSSATRQEMVNIANLLRAYNNEPSTP